mgnify:CR=1 FL=1
MESLGAFADNVPFEGLLFCDPDCPFCPPGVMGSTNAPGGDGDDDDEDQSSSESESGSSTAAMQTVLYGTDIAGDSFPTTFAALADLSVSNTPLPP